jgi:hypothetical protein
VYRATVAGGPFQLLNTELAALPNYNDYDVNCGTTYYYYVTAVNANGLEGERSNIASATDGVITYWMQDYRGPQGSEVALMFNVEDAGGICGISLTLTYCENILTYVRTEAVPVTNVAGYSLVANDTGGAVQLVYVAPEPGIAGEGGLFRIVFRVSDGAQDGAECAHIVTSVQMSDCAQDPSILQVEGDDSATFKVSSYYRAGDYNGDGEVNILDAVAFKNDLEDGIRTGTAEQLMAVDFNGNGRLDPGDYASLLRLLAGLPIYDTADNTGSSYPDNILSSASQVSGYTLSMPETLAMVGEEVTVSLSISNAQDFACGRFWINYDSSYLTLKSLRTTELTNGFESGYQVTDDGRAILFLASETALTGGSGAILQLVFDVNGSVIIPAKTSVVLAEVELYGQYAQDLSWDSTIATVNGTVYVARPGLNLYPDPTRRSHGAGIVVSYLIVPAGAHSGEYDISFGIISVPEGDIFVTDNRFERYLPFESIRQTPRVARGVDFSCYQRGSVGITVPEHTCTDNFRFAAAVFERSTNTIAQLSRSVEVKIAE